MKSLPLAFHAFAPQSPACLRGGVRKRELRKDMKPNGFMPFSAVNFRSPYLYVVAGENVPKDIENFFCQKVPCKPVK